MKKIIGRIIISLFIITLFVVGLSFIKNNTVEEKDLLAYVETSEIVYETVDDTTTTTESTTTTSETTTTTTTKKTTTTSVIEGIGEIKGNVDTYYLNLLNKELNKLPQRVLSRFVNSGWHIYVTNENIAKTVFDGKYSGVQGVTIYKDRTILISARETAIKESTIHEFGHFIDYMIGFKSDSKEFIEIYDEEVETFKSRIPNSSCVRDTQEFFAETLLYIYKDPSKCTTKAYEYVSNKLNNF